MRRHPRLLVAALTLPLLLLTPLPSEAQRGRAGQTGARVAQSGGRQGGGGGVAVPRGRPVYGGGHYGSRYYGSRYYGYRPYYYYGGYPYYSYPYSFGFGFGFGYGYGYYGWPMWGYPWYPPYGGYYSGYGYASSVRVQVTPKIAEVYVDGFRAGIVDEFDGTFQRLHVEPGPHEIAVYLEGYRSIRHQLYLSPGDEYKIREVMQPLGPGEQASARPVPTQMPETGYRGRAPYPATRYYPEGARVRERAVPDNAPPGAPEPAETMPPDRMPPERAQPGEPSWAGPVVEGFGALVVRVQPPDAEVYIDGERWRTPEGTDEVTVQLAAGPHRIEVRKAGFRSFAADVTVVAGTTEPVNVSLPRER